MVKLFGKRPLFAKTRTSARKRLFSDKERKRLARTGAAMPGGRYPIQNARDLANAIADYNRTGQPAAVRAHIIERAKALGLSAPFQKAVAVEEGVGFSVPVELLKAEGERPLKEGLVWGWASIIEKDGKVVTDHQGDQIEPDELVKAAHDFMLNSRAGGHMHLYKRDGAKEPLKVGDVVESVVLTHDLQKALGVDLGKVGWLIGFRVTDPEVRKAVASGKLKSFSIGGTGRREEI